jgi:hydrogenase maturation protease
MTRLCIAGVGSAFGADRIGWDAVEAVAANAPPFSAEEVLLRCCAPFELPPLLATAEAAILVDALVGDNKARGWLLLDAAALAPRHELSSHGFGIAQALAVLRALGRLPSPLLLYGIRIDDPAASAAPPLPDGLIAEIAHRAARILCRCRQAPA